MRSRTSSIVSDRQVQALAEEWLRKALPLKDVGPKCTARVLWQIVLLAAARMCSLFAACRDLANAPCDQAVRDGLAKCLPKRPRTLEAWLEPALAGQLPKALFDRAREVAIDWHLIPYHGQPHEHANELYRSQPKSGTTKFHAYATACIVEKGFRYTLAATSVTGNESLIDVLERLLLRLGERGLRIKTLLLDRQFFTANVLEYLQACQIPFVMPVVLRGKQSKRRQTKRGQKRRRGRKSQHPVKLRDFRRQPAGRYRFTWTVKQTTVTFHVVVAYKSLPHHDTGKRKSKKLLYAAWGVRGAPVEIRELYRRRFGIEASYRQLGQARIRTCTREPVLRLFFVLVALVLRNVWVWLHFTYFTTRRGRDIKLHLECLRFRRMLDWIARVITNLLHDHSQLFTQSRVG